MKWRQLLTICAVILFAASLPLLINHDWQRDDSGVRTPNATELDWLNSCLAQKPSRVVFGTGNWQKQMDGNNVILSHRIIQPLDYWWSCMIDSTTGRVLATTL